jgi:hypothetical protein
MPLLAAPAARVHHGHRRYHGRFLPMERLAVAIGVGALTATDLVVHPTTDRGCATRHRARRRRTAVRAPIGKPCRCNASCDAAFTRARDSRDRRDSLAVRDSCALRAWRYSDGQIRFPCSRLCQVLQ